MSNNMPVLLSACLAGKKCKFDGTSAGPFPDYFRLEDIQLACPEEAGGLPTPRERAEIVGGDGFDVLDGRARVMTESGREVTAEYIAGAYEVLAQARASNCKVAILQEFSPACGRQEINDGTFSKSRRDGVGVLTALLLRSGFNVTGRRGAIKDALDENNVANAERLRRAQGLRE